MEIKYSPIGYINSEHKIAEKTPIQPVFAKDCKGTLEILPEYIEGLSDLDGFSHIIIIFHFHKTKNISLSVKPFLENVKHGIFATRAPCRPNPIGISIVRLIEIKSNILFLNDIDILSGTPVLDIKPYINRFDKKETIRNGWQNKIDEATAFRLGKRKYSERNNKCKNTT